MLARSLIDCLDTEAKVQAVAKEIQDIYWSTHLRTHLKYLGVDENLVHFKTDPFIQSALCEAVALVIRQNLRVAREAVQIIDPYYLDIDSEEDFWLLFDKF